MVIDGTKKFTCNHEYLPVFEFFVCHKCNLTREDLPVQLTEPHLLFFPVPSAKVEQMAQSGESFRDFYQPRLT